MANGSTCHYPVSYTVVSVRNHYLHGRYEFTYTRMELDLDPKAELRDGTATNAGQYHISLTFYGNSIRQSCLDTMISGLDTIECSTCALRVVSLPPPPCMRAHAKEGSAGHWPLL